MDMVKISKPKIRGESPCIIEGADTSYAGKLAEAVGKGGLINVQLEQDVIIQRISHDLYSDPASGLRELYANERRACLLAKKRHGATPRIEVTFDEPNRGLTIHGIDSLGIEQDVFIQVLSVLGRSNNFDRSMPGQFGMGFASYTCLSDIVIVETYARNGDRYAVMGKGGLGFQILPEPKMDSYGTKIRITLKPGIDYAALDKMLRRCAMLSGVDTILYRSDSEGTVSHTCKRMTLAESVNEYNGHRGRPIISFESDSVSIAALFLRGGYPRVEAHLAGMPINFEYNGSFDDCMYSMAINVKSEGRFVPTPDRERFTEDSSKRLSVEIDELIALRISEMTYETHHEYVSDPESSLLDDITGTKFIRDGVTARIKQFMDTVYVTDCFGSNRIANIRKSHKPLIAKSLVKRKINAARSHDNSTVAVRVPEADYDSMKALGFPTLDDYIKTNKIVIDGTRGIKTYRVYRMDYGEYTPVPVDDIGDEVIMAGRDFDRLYQKFRYAKEGSSMKICRAKKAGNRGTTLEEYYDRISGYLYNTNHGVLTASQIIGCGLDVCTTDERFFHMVRDDIMAVYPGMHPITLDIALNGGIRPLRYSQLHKEHVSHAREFRVDLDGRATEHVLYRLLSKKRGDVHFSRYYEKLADLVPTRFHSAVYDALDELCTEIEESHSRRYQDGGK